MGELDTGEVAFLRKRHAELEHLIKNEYARPHPDDSELKRLKLEKLHVKEEIDRLARC